MTPDERQRLEALVDQLEGIRDRKNAVPHSPVRDALTRIVNKIRALAAEAGEELPKDLRPVLAYIFAQSDLGPQQWREVIYHDGIQWKSYAGSKTFEDGEQVLRWVYADEALPFPPPPKPEAGRAD